MSSSMTRVSVPGKLILMGEHAAVYGCPALVASLGLRMSVQLEPTGSQGVRLSLPDLGREEHLEWDELRAVTSEARRAWQAFAADPTPERSRALRQQRPGDLVAVALGEVIEAAGDRPEERGHPCHGLRVAVESAIPVGSGLGSSAAAAVGVVGGYLATRGLDHGWSAVHPVALEVERRQHGFPSGIDAATVFHGGLLWCHRGEDGLFFEPLAARPRLLRRFHVFHTGRPPESTGEVVAGVRALRERDRVDFDEQLERMEDATRQLREFLDDDATSDADLVDPVRRYHRALRAIGVVPDPVQRIVRQVEAAGGAAKISGAGSLAGPGAGSLIVVHRRPEEIELLTGLQRYEAPLAVEGLRVETVA